MSKTGEPLLKCSFCAEPIGDDQAPPTVFFCDAQPNEVWCGGCRPPRGNWTPFEGLWRGRDDREDMNDAEVLAFAQKRDADAARDQKNTYSDAVGVGMVIAAGIAAFCGGEVIAEKILGAAGITSSQDAEKIGVDEYDIRLLAKVFDDPAPPEQETETK